MNNGQHTPHSPSAATQAPNVRAEASPGFRAPAEPPRLSDGTGNPAQHAAWREVDGYFNDAFLSEDAALVEARRSGTNTTMPGAEIARNQGAFLSMLTQISGARRVLEFGTLAGYSTICFARAVGERGAVTTLELSPENAEVARANFVRAGVEARVQVLLGPAAESAQHLIDQAVEPFDLVFIDADKPNNPKYLAAALELTRPGAVIVIDNVVRSGAVNEPGSVDPAVLGVRQVVSDIADDDRLEAVALQTVGEKGWDGLVVARRR